MKNLPKEKRDRLILIVLVTIVCIAGLYYLVIRTQNQALQQIANQTREQETKLGNAQRLIGSAPEFQQSFEHSSKKLASIEDGMAAGDMYSWLILTINKFRAERKVDIPQFSREITTEVGIFPKFPYKAVLFSVRGSAYYHDFGKFISDFENTFPFMRVQNIEMEPAAASSATSTVTPDAEKLSFKMEIVALINPNTN